MSSLRYASAFRTRRPAGRDAHTLRRMETHGREFAAACGIHAGGRDGSLVSIAVPLRRVVCSATLTTNPQQLAMLSLNRPRVFRADDVSSDVEMDEAAAAAVRRGGGDDDDDGRRYKTPETLHEVMAVCSSDKKPLVLIQLLQALGKHPSIVFASSIDKVHRLTRLLQLYGGLPGRVVEFSANLPQRQRSRVLKWVRAAAAAAVAHQR